MHRAFAALLGLSVSILVLSCSTASRSSSTLQATPAQSVAEVDGTPIPAAAFEEACGRLKIASEALRDAVDSHLVERAAKARGLHADERLPPAERRRALLAQLVPVITAAEIPEALVASSYQQSTSNVPYEEARPRLAAGLAAAVSGAHVAEALRSLRSSANITYSPTAQCSRAPFPPPRPDSGEQVTPPGALR